MGVKLQDIVYPVAGVATSGQAGFELAWKWFQDNFEAIKTKLSTGLGLLGGLIGLCASKFVTEEKIQEVEKFFEEHPMPNQQRKISQVIESARTNAKWLESMQAGKMGDDGFFVLISMTMDMN